MFIYETLSKKGGGDKQHVGRNYVLYINKSYRRTDTLWEDRHKASLVYTDNYVLSTYRYIEMNLVAASMVDTPDEYRWSFYGWHAWGNKSDLITAHPLFDPLGIGALERQHAYRELSRP